MKSAITGLVWLFAYMPFQTEAFTPEDTSAISVSISSKYIRSIGERSESISLKIDESSNKIRKLGGGW